MVRPLSRNDVVTRGDCTGHLPKINLAPFLHFTVISTKGVLSEQGAIRNSASYSFLDQPSEFLQRSLSDSYGAGCTRQSGLIAYRE